MDFIQSNIEAGVPLVIGIDYKPGSVNADKTTDHFAIAVGIGHDEKGNYILFFDNATSHKQFGASNDNRLYFDSSAYVFSGYILLKPGYIPKYIITQIRPSIKK